MPPYLFLILVSYKFMIYVGNDSEYYPYVEDMFSLCADNWWKNALLIDNLEKMDQCFGWGWYLAVDF